MSVMAGVAHSNRTVKKAVIKPSLTGKGLIMVSHNTDFRGLRSSTFLSPTLPLAIPFSLAVEEQKSHVP